MNFPIADVYRVHFTDDGTTTLVIVLEDDDVAETVADVCEMEGWDTQAVGLIEWIETTEPDLASEVLDDYEAHSLYPVRP